MSQSVRDPASRGPAAGGKRRYRSSSRRVCAFPTAPSGGSARPIPICGWNERRTESSIVMPPPAPDTANATRESRLSSGTGTSNSGLGTVFDSSVGFTLPNTAIRGPDASWMTKERWDALPKVEREKFAHICPDFVVELRSKSDDMSKLKEKMDEYVAQGIRLGWLIDPRGRPSKSIDPAVPSKNSTSRRPSPARTSCRDLCST